MATEHASADLDDVAPWLAAAIAFILTHGEQRPPGGLSKPATFSKAKVLLSLVQPSSGGVYCTRVHSLVARVETGFEFDTWILRSKSLALACCHRCGARLIV